MSQTFVCGARVPLVGGPIVLLQLTVPLHELNAHDISLMLIVSGHGGLNLSFYKACLEYSSLLIIFVVFFF